MQDHHTQDMKVTCTVKNTGLLIQCFQMSNHLKQNLSCGKCNYKGVPHQQKHFPTLQEQKPARISEYAGECAPRDDTV